MKSIPILVLLVGLLVLSSQRVGAQTRTDVHRGRVEIISTASAATCAGSALCVGNGTGSVYAGAATFTGAIGGDVTGTVTSGFTDSLKLIGWSALGGADSNVTLAVGGYRSSQWSAVKTYTSGSLRTTVGAGLSIGSTTDPGAGGLAVNGAQVDTGMTAYNMNHTIGATETDVYFTANATVTLPTCSGSAGMYGRIIHIYVKGTSGATLTVSGTTDPTITTLNAGDAIGLLCDGGSTWLVQ